MIRKVTSELDFRVGNCSRTRQSSVFVEALKSGDSSYPKIQPGQSNRISSN
jgi:hypothetical protein